jgi:hypothetical protein
MPGRIGLSILNSARSNDGAIGNLIRRYTYICICMCCILELRQVIINPWISHAYSHVSILKENHADHISSLNLTPTGGRMRSERWEKGNSWVQLLRWCLQLGNKKGKKESGTRRSFFGDPLQGLGDPADTLLITLLIMCTPFFDHSNNNRQKHQWKQTAARGFTLFLFFSLLDFLSAHFPPSYPPVGTTYPPVHAIIPIFFSLYNIPTAECARELC